MVHQVSCYLLYSSSLFLFGVLGWGTNENAIISILGHRNLFQRKLIRQAYQEIYHEDLIHQLKSELSGNFEV